MYTYRGRECSRGRLAAARAVHKRCHVEPTEKQIQGKAAARGPPQRRVMCMLDELHYQLTALWVYIWKYTKCLAAQRSILGVLYIMKEGLGRGV